MAVATSIEAKELRRLSERVGGLIGAEQRILRMRENGLSVKVIRRKTEYPQWFIDRVLNVV